MKIATVGRGATVRLVAVKGKTMDLDADDLDWDLEERDAYMAEHEGAEDEPEVEVVVRTDE